MTDDTQGQTDQRDADEQDQHDDTTDVADLGDAGKAALDAERKARKAAEKRARDAEKRLADLDAAERKRQEDEATAQGKWQELAEQREAALTEATTTRDDLQARLDTALKVISDTLAATWDGVPDEIRALYDGPDDDPLTKQAFLAKPATQKLIERLTAGAEKPGNGPNPPPAGPQELNITEEAQKARQRGAYRL